MRPTTEDLEKRIETLETEAVALRRRLEMVGLLSRISSSFVGVGTVGDGFEEKIQAALERIARFLDVDRCSLVLFSPDLQFVREAFVWQAATGARPTTGMSLSPFRWAVDRLSRNETIIVERMADLPPEAGEIRRGWEKIGSRSVMAIPLMIGNRLEGLFGFCGMSREIAWSEKDRMILKIMGEMFSNLIARRQAEEAGRAKERFLATVSHEIRTPVSGIIGMTRMALAGDLNGETRRHLELIRGSAKGLLAIVNDILDYSAIAAGRLSVSFRIFDLQELVSAICDVFDVGAREKGLNLVCRVDAAAPRLAYGDPDRLSQVLNNLLGNAVKFTEKGEVAIRVSLTGAMAPFRRPLFSVSDTGIGIPEDRIEDIFESFQQLESARDKRYAGTGLGLYISKALVERMGGAIGVWSRVKKGSRFYFTLPCGAVRPTFAAADTTPVSHDGPSLSILLAEDERLNRLHLVFGLENLGHRVEAVENGHAALDALEKARYDLVIMDIQMPGMDGVTAARRIRGATGGTLDSSVPIIALSAYVTEKDRQAFFDAGVDAFASKPVEMEDLKRVIEQVVGERS